VLPIASVDLRRTPTAARLELATAEGDREHLARFFAATGEPMTALQADGDPDAPQPANVTRRNALKAWHRGNVAGIAGQVLGLCAALGLVALIGTGLRLYTGLCKARRRTGKRSLFWRAREPLWRRLHRWIALGAATFLLNLSITGAVLAAGEIQLWAFLTLHVVPPPYPRPSPLPPVSEAALTTGIPAMLDGAYKAALAAEPSSPVTSIQLVHRGGMPKALVTLGGANPRTLVFRAGTDTRVEDWATRGVQKGQGYFADWHQVFKRLHRGDIVGHFTGRYLALAVGLALGYLLVSGLVMYFDLRRRRHDAGRSGWFWR